MAYPETPSEIPASMADTHAEIAALPAGWRLVEATPLTVPGQDGERHLVTVGRA